MHCDCCWRHKGEDERPQSVCVGQALSKDVAANSVMHQHILLTLRMVL